MDGLPNPDTHLACAYYAHARVFVSRDRPDSWEMILGGVLFGTSGKGYQDLQYGFAQAIEIEDTSNVVNGLYHIIRHPKSLANILFCIACPL